MVKKFDNEFKVMIVKLLNSDVKIKQVSEDYGLSFCMVGRWKREYKLKSVDFIKKRVLSLESQETQEFKNQKSRTNNQELRTKNQSTKPTEGENNKLVGMRRSDLLTFLYRITDERNGVKKCFKKKICRNDKLLL